MLEDDIEDDYTDCEYVDRHVLYTALQDQKHFQQDNSAQHIFFRHHGQRTPCTEQKAKCRATPGGIGLVSGDSMPLSGCAPTFGDPRRPTLGETAVFTSESSRPTDLYTAISPGALLSPMYCTVQYRRRRRRRCRYHQTPLV